MTAITTPKNTPESIPYSSRLDFTPGGTALVRLLSLKVHADAAVSRGTRAPEKSGRREHHLYLDLPGVLQDRKTGRQTPYTLTLLIGPLLKEDNRWVADSTTMDWLERRGQAPRVWNHPDQASRWVQRAAKRDLAETTREVLAAVQTTT